MVISQIRQLTRLLDEMGCAYLREEPMSRRTSFRIGGPAELFVTPDAGQLPGVLQGCRGLGVPHCLIGNGSNLVVSDEGVRGAVISLGAPMSRIVREKNELVAQAGATLAQLCRLAQQQGLAGLEFAWGIPGSVGGAVFMNAGAYGGEMKDVVQSVTALFPDGEYAEISAGEIGFGYRTSRFQDQKAAICAARFSLRPDDPAAIDARMRDIFARRMEKQPLDLPSAGSAFKRPAGGYAAALIEQCGLKGLSVGAAQVSVKHAGFIVNTGGATCAEVDALCRQIRDEVLRKTGIALEPEIRRI
jgi:UDP-N-acetylmuramate dehydrogenase